MREVKMPYDVYVSLVRYMICDDKSDDVKQTIVDWINCKSDSLQQREEYSKHLKEL